jgi:WD40 repeat protein
VAVSPDGGKVLSGGADSKVRLAETGTGRELRRLAGHTMAVLAVAFHSDGHAAVSVAADRTVWWWNLDRDEDRQLANLSEKADYVIRAAALGPGGKFLAYIGDDGRLVLWEPEPGRKVAQVEVGKPVTHIVFSPDGDYLATANANGTVSVFHIHFPVAKPEP